MGKLMGFFANILGLSPEKVKGKCISLYEDAKRQRPQKSTRDCLKIILLTKPPFDYQLDNIIEKILDEYGKIESLSEFISKSRNNKGLWESRKRNLERGQVQERNRLFFAEFWGQPK